MVRRRRLVRTAPPQLSFRPAGGHYWTSIRGSLLNADQQEESIRSAARQVFDLPPPPPLIVTEHRAHTCQCYHCGAQTRAAFPEEVTSPAQYGDGIVALAAYLQTLHCILEKRLAQLIWILTASRSQRQRWQS